MTSSVPPPGELARGATIGRYTIIRTLGAGGMGVVYLAFDPELDRRVAVKLLRASPDPGSSSEGPARLLREAQVMAKLSHPNVIAVFDVGQFNDDVFVAMEYVRGVTLREWWAKPGRTPEEVVAVCVQAGRGLAAAHGRGVLHRDFKPENVLVEEGAAARARVLDFGLARSTVAETTGTGRFELDDTLVGKRVITLQPLTQVGTVLGTPAYMAPEQILGGEVDARSDQFAFAIVAYEALYGARPFRGETLGEVLTEMDAGRVRPPPKGARAPRGVFPVLARALARKPEDRWPSVDALLDALERVGGGGARRSGATWGVGVAIVVAVVAGIAVARASRPPPCGGAAGALAGVWDDAARAEVTRAFRASGNANAEPMLARVQGALDQYAKEWADMSTDACLATRVRGEQSDEALDLRTACLRGRLDDARALAELLRHADAQLVDNAYGAVLRLPPVAGCADVRALRASYEPIQGEAKKLEADAVRRDVANVAARYNAGRCEEAMPIAVDVAKRASALGVPSVEAEALYWRARVGHVCGDAKAANDAAFQAAADAERSHQDELRARCLVELVYLQGTQLARYDEALDFGRLAEAAIQRIAATAPSADRQPPFMFAELARARGWVEYTRGDLPAALPLRREALVRHVEAIGDKDPDAIQIHAELADLEFEAGQYREALADEREVLHRAIDLLGPRHMRTGRYTLDVAETLVSQGKYAEAQTWLDRSRPIVSLDVADHQEFVDAVQRFGTGDVDGGDARLLECVRRADKEWGPEDPYPLSVEGDRAKWLAVHRRTDRAMAAARAVVERVLATKDPNNPWLPNGYAAYALLLARAGRADDALPHADRAIAMSEKGAMGQLPFALLAKGEALLAKGDRAGAIAPLDRARTQVEERDGIDGVIRGDIAAALAKALAGSDDARAAAMADEAKRDYAASSEPGFASAK